jgi:hydroxyacylglutathione hydrolase
MKITSICLGALATNCYLVEHDGTVALIDPAEDSERLHAFVGNRRVDVVLNTHGHFDHTGGIWAYPDAPVRIHKADLMFLEQSFPDHPPVGASLEEGETVAGLRVLHTPGHSPGSVVFLADGVLICGDLLFAGSIGRTDLPGGSMNVMGESLRRICDLPGDYAVYPGHGPTTTLEAERRENPFLIGWG